MPDWNRAGRNDYVDPDPMSLGDVERVQCCCVRPRRPEEHVPKAKPFLHHIVSVGGRDIGFVTDRIGGQFWKIHIDDEWTPVFDDKASGDPPFGRAILCLLNAYEQIREAEEADGR